MPATTHITIDMLISETERIGHHMKKTYPTMVAQNKITPYEMDYRINCNAEMLTLLRYIKTYKTTGNDNFLTLIHNLP